MKTKEEENIIIRKVKPEDLNKIQILYSESIRWICSKDYTESQIKAWISGTKNTNRWLKKIETQYFLVAFYKELPVGFCSLENGNHLDMLYVHKDFQRKGIAKRLVTAIEAEARRQHADEISAEVSITANPFFTNIGYDLIRQQTVMIGNVPLVNYKMKKNLK